MTKHIIYLVLFLLFISCSNEEQTYSIGEGFHEPDVSLGVVDTLTVKASTILLDSFVTSGFNKVFIGDYSDEYSGKMNSKSFIPFGLSDYSPTIDDESIFDSLVLVLVQNGEYFGDTNLLQSFSVHRVTEDIEQEEGDLFYNTSTFSFNEESLGQKEFFSRPSSSDELLVRLSDELGQEWFDKIVNDDESMYSTEEFLGFFNGLVIVSTENESSWSASFYGNNLSSTLDGEPINEVQIRLYYSQPNEEENEFYPFVPKDIYSIFSNIQTNRSGSYLELLSADDNEMSSNQTNNLLYLQAGAGIAIKLDFPGIDRLYEINKNLSILDAELIFNPYKGSYNQYNKLPESIQFYWTDKKNRINDVLTDITGQYAETANLVIDNEFDENTHYSISVVNFVSIELLKEEFTDDALMLLLSTESFATSFQRLIIEDQEIKNSSLQLKIHYITY